MRALLHIILPLLLPILVYLLWVTIMQGRRPPEWLENAPWAWIGSAAAVLAATSLALWALLGGDEPGGVYVPPAVEDGVIRPSRIER